MSMVIGFEFHVQKRRKRNLSFKELPCLLNAMFMTTIENECFEIWSKDCVATKETRRAKDFKQKANTYTPVLVKQASR